MKKVRSTFATEPILQNMKTQIFSKRILFLLFASWMCIGTLFSASRQMEYLDCGVVAVKVNNGVFISWRYLGTDDPSIGFNIYRDGTKVNASPITTKTNYVDGQGGTNSKYVVKAVVGGKEISESKVVTPWGSQQRTIKLNSPGSSYSANDMSVGDVDGDGKITAIDANLIRKYIAKIIDELPI